MKTKLVRDRIPEIMLNREQVPVYYIAGSEEFKNKLFEKLQEEIAEFINDPSEEELADIEEVLEALLSYFKLDAQKLSDVKELKYQQKGGFSKRYILIL